MDGCMSVVLFSNFHFDFDINAVVSSKVSLDATLLAILTKNGTLRIVYLPEKETDSIEITGDVISFEWHDHGIDDHNELAVCKENGFSFYIITFETSVNSQKIASGKKQAVLKCIESCLLPIGDLSEFVQNHGFVLKTIPTIKILDYVDNICIILIDSYVIRLYVANQCYTLKTIFKIKVQSCYNHKFVQASECHIFSFIWEPSTLFVYDLRTGAPVSAIDLVELPLNSCLTIGEKSHISVSYHSDYFTVIDDDHHAYCFSVENIVHSSRPQLTRTQTTVDTISVKSFATTIASLDDISDSISVTGSVPGHSFGGPISERVKHRHKNRDFISISRKTPFWISSKKSKDHTITGFGAPAEVSRFAKDCKNSAFRELNITKISSVQSLHTNSSTVVLWDEDHGNGFGGVTIIDVQTGHRRASLRFQEHTFVIINRKNASPCLLLTVKSLSSLSYDVVQEEIVSKFMLYENASAADWLSRNNCWECISMPLNVLELGLKTRQLDAISFFLKKSYDDDFDVGPKPCDLGVTHFQTVMSLVISALKDSLNEHGSRSFGEQLLQIALQHLNRVMKYSVTQLETRTSSCSSSLEHEKHQLGYMAMEYLADLRFFLKGHPKLETCEQQLSDASNYLLMKLKGIPRLSQIWEKWLDLDSNAIIRDAVWNRCLPLAQVFCLKQNKWRDFSYSFSHTCIPISFDMVMEFLLSEDVESAVLVLTNMGFDVDIHLKELLMNTANPKLRQLLQLKLRERRFLTTEEEVILERFEEIQRLYPCHSFNRADQISLNKRCWNKEDLKRWKDAFLIHLPWLIDEGPPTEFHVGDIHVNSDNCENLDYSCLTLNWTKNWTQEMWEGIFTEALLLKGIENLKLSPETIWTYLLQHHCVEQILEWIKNCYGARKDEESASLYPMITPKMVDSVYRYISPHFSDSILDELAQYGILSDHEATNFALYLKRLVRNRTKEQFSILLTSDEFHKQFISSCVINSLPHVLYHHMEQFSISDEVAKDVEECCEIPWFKMIMQFKRWNSDPADCSHVFHCSLGNAESKLQIICGSVQDILKANNPLIGLATLLYAPCSLNEVVGQPANVEEALWKIDRKVFETALATMPQMQPLILPLLAKQDLVDLTQDITVYDLLKGSTPLDIAHLFGWQTTHSFKSSEAFRDLPYFSHPELVRQYGHVQDMDFTFYIKQGRPCFAYAKFIIHCVREFNSVPQKQIIEACNKAHAVAIQYFHLAYVAASSVAFLEMLNWNTVGLRIDLKIAQIILEYLNKQMPDMDIPQDKEVAEKTNRKEIGFLLKWAILGDQNARHQLLEYAEKAVLFKLQQDKIKWTSVAACHQWTVVVMFCRRYGLPLVTSFLKACAEENDWIMFSFFAEIHMYPKYQMLKLLSHYSNKPVMQHVANAFTKLRYVTIHRPSPKLKKFRRPQDVKDVRANLYRRIPRLASSLKHCKSEQSPSSNIIQGESPKSCGSVTESSDDNSASAASLKSSEGSPTLTLDDIPSDMLRVILYCHQQAVPWQALLKCSLLLKNSCLSILAACYQESNLLDCLCVWLLASVNDKKTDEVTLPNPDTLLSYTWSLTDLQILIRHCFYTEQLSVLAEGFYYFQPDCPLYSLLKGLELFLIEKSPVACLSFLKKYQLGMNHASDIAGCSLDCKQWLMEISVEIINLSLLNITNHYEVIALLRLICEHQLMSTVISAVKVVPDYALTLQTLELVVNSGITFNLKQLLRPKNDCIHVEECYKVLDDMLQKKQFLYAYKFAQIIGLPKSVIVLSQMHEEVCVQQILKPDKDFKTKAGIWKHCIQVFKDNKVPEGEVSYFFKGYGMQITRPSERFFVLSLAWLMLRKWLQNHTSQESDSTEDEEEELELEMWLARINAELEDTEEGILDISEVTNELSVLKRDLLTISANKQTSEEIINSGSRYLDNCVYTLATELEKQALLKIIGQELDQGNIDVAYRLSVMFNQSCTCLNIILTCMKLAERHLMLHQVDVDIRRLLDKVASVKPRKLSSRTLSSSLLRSSSSVHSFISNSDISSEVGTDSSSLALGNEDVPESLEDVPVENDVLLAMQQLLEHCDYGSLCCSRIMTLYKISQVLQVEYVDIVQNWDAVTLLKGLLQSKHCARFFLAKDYIVSNNIEDEFVASFLCEHILCALRMFTGNTIAEDQHMKSSSELLLKPTDFSKVFIQLANLCQDPSVLGMKLINLIQKTPNDKASLSLQVELCTHGHRCFTIACHVEGITCSLQKAKTLGQQLTEAGEFSLLVHLLTGIGRFSEMTYVFDILRENHQFELLFRKGMDKITDLKVALLDYLRRFHLADTDSFTMIALRFSMYREIAELHELDADQQIETLDLQSNDSKGKLEVIMQFLVDAADSYAKAKCYQHAVHCAKRAELFALQIHLHAKGIAVLKLNSSEVSKFIVDHSRVSEAFIVAEAYAQHQDWAQALYNNFVLKNLSSYLKDFINKIGISPSIVDEITRRFKKEANKTPKMISNMQHILKAVEDVQLRYQLANELEFQDVITDLLHGESANFLKDCAVSK